MKTKSRKFQSNFLLFTLFFLVSCRDGKSSTTIKDAGNRLVKYEDVENNTMCYQIKGYSVLSCVVNDGKLKEDNAFLQVEIIRLQAELTKHKKD